MNVVTSDKLKKSKPQTQLDWCGNPMKEGDGYGGRPEHFNDAQRMEHARRSIPVNTEEKRQQKRAAMAYAREAYKVQREKLRLRREKRKADKLKASSTDIQTVVTPSKEPSVAP